ncbi:ABC transporter permease [Gluconobacter cerinus]|uniref:Oligopeptide transporter permease OppB n=1 Tax=Gluconobacter cerinus TaxID=38307 RepID=A0A1B6VG89_9PROT|nr:ABC transporter permease [Gluconobacter cerinus]OAJ66210.1 oligopeptide transporter permease OppB [Gluconobacter cerinus]
MMKHLASQRLIGRIGLSLGMLFASATLTFLAVRMMPGDPATIILGGAMANPTPGAVAAITKEYGLDRPLIVQYGFYVWRLLHGDLGVSFSQHLRVAEVLRQQMLPTLALASISLLLAWMLALLSVFCTVRRGRVLSTVGASFDISAAALPPFWLGIVLLWILAFRLHLLPPAGSSSLASLIMPALSLAIPLGGFLAQVTRESLEIALDEPFILSARMRGLCLGQVLRRHALRHALLPGIALSAWALGALLGETAVIEAIFSRKGLGRTLVYAVSAQDMPLTTGIVLFVTVAYIFASLGIEFIHELVDPRLAKSRGQGVSS